jgi:autotransporter-associated beta strand protein
MSSAQAQTAIGATWNNLGSQWTNGASWIGGNAPTNNNATAGNVATFSNAAVGNNTVNLGVDREIFGVLFTTGANAYTFSGSNLTLNGTYGISNFSANLQTFNNKILNVSNSIYGSYAAGGSLVFAGGIDITSASSSASRTLTLGGSGNITVSGAIANGGTATAGAVTITNTGLTIFSGSNTYGGLTTVSGGARLQLGNAGALGSTVGLTRVSSGGAIDLNGQTILGEGLTNSGTGVSSSGSLYNSSASAATWSGNITPSADSTIKATNGSITLSGGIDLNNNAASSRTLTLDGTGGVIVSGNISNSFTASTGNIAIAATASNVTLSGNNSYSGTTTINGGGAMNINSANAISTNTFTIGTSSFLNNTSGSAITNLGNNNIALSDLLTFGTAGSTAANSLTLGTGTVTATSGRIITIAGTNVTLGLGTLDSTSTSSGRTFTANGAGNTLSLVGWKIQSGSSSNVVAKLAGTANWTITGPIVNGNGFSNGVQIDATGLTTFGGNNTYDGATIVSSNATLRITSAAGLGSTNTGTTVDAGGQLQLSGGITVEGEALSLSGGAGSLATLRNITGNNTYNGAITFTSGTNRFDSDAGTLTVASFSTNLASTRSLNIGGAGNTVIAGALDGSGAGRLIKDGAGTLTISAANTVGGTGSNGVGGITVGAGSLIVSSTGSLNKSSSSVIISNGASMRYNGSTALFAGSVSLGDGGGPGRAVLGGTGTINSAVTLDSLNDVLSPGNSPGIQNFTPAQTWSSFTYDWELNNFAGTTAGTDFDKIVIAGALDLSATPPSSYGLSILSLTAGNVTGNVPNFTEVNTTWTILSAGGALTGFDAADWGINASGFTTGTAYLGAFSLAQVGNELQLTYTVPEPSTYALLGVSALACGAWCIRRRRKS